VAGFYGSGKRRLAPFGGGGHKGISPYQTFPGMTLSCYACF
jgi:hypothetical protein